MRWFKIIVAVVFAGAVVAAFFGVPFTSAATWIQAGPAAVAALAAPKHWSDAVPFAAIILITVLFGRFFCESMCPLGILQSFINWLFHPKTHVRRVCTRLPETRAQINRFLSYPEDSAGSVMTAELIELRVKVAELLNSGVAFKGALIVDFGRTEDNPLDIDEASAGISIARYTGEAPVNLRVKTINTGIQRARAAVDFVDGVIVMKVDQTGFLMIVR